MFIDQPFHLNPKCIAFGTMLCLAYWFLPAQKNPWMLVFIFNLGYIAMAWYDYLYKCQSKMYSGTLQGYINTPFKPREDQGKMHRRNVYLFHMLAVAPLLMYVGYEGKNANPRVFGPLLGVGALALIYHGFRLIDN